MHIYKELVELFLPEDILKYFNFAEFKKEGVDLCIFLGEKKDPPVEYKNKRIRANGFLNEFKITDFPLRNKMVTLHIKRRR